MILSLTGKFKKLSGLIMGNAYIFFVRFFYSCHIGKKVKFYGVPIVNLTAGSKFHVDDYVTMNSLNFDYHINMFSPCKIFIEGDGAIISIGAKSRLHGVCLHARKSIRIGERCLIAANCNIVDSNGHKTMMGSVEERYLSVDDPKEIVIEDDVWIGANSFILPGVRICKGAVVSANSVVRNDVPPYSIVCGNPAKVISKNE